MAKLETIGEDGAERLQSLKQQLADSQGHRDQMERELKQQLSECAESNAAKVNELQKMLAVTAQNHEF